MDRGGVGIVMELMEGGNVCLGREAKDGRKKKKKKEIEIRLGVD
jgi:hypothetical protein